MCTGTLIVIFGFSLLIFKVVNTDIDDHSQANRAFNYFEDYKAPWGTNILNHLCWKSMRDFSFDPLTYSSLGYLNFPGAIKIYFPWDDDDYDNGDVSILP